MYTRCPHCTTIFRVTAEQLRTAHSEIPCVTCGESFSALGSLSDDITMLITAVPPVSDMESLDADTPNPDTDTTPIDPDFADTIHSDEALDDDTGNSITINTEALIKTEGTQDDDEQIDDSADNQTSMESMEFDAPEQTWTKFFLRNDVSESPQDGDQEQTFDIDADPISKIQLGDADVDNSDEDSPLEFQTANQDEWHDFLEELKDDEVTPAADTWDEEQIDSGGSDAADEEDEIPIIPPWLDDEIADESAGQRQVFRPSWSVLGTCAVLILLLAGQLIHYNRDSLAADEIYGATIRQTYALFGAQLYPDWPLEAFAITGTEAITGRSSPDALDILANVIVSGRQPVGLPLIRVELQDRWTNPVASRVFTPAEYLRDFNPETFLVNPGSALPVDISVTDPGTAALSYVVDVCLPRRKTGLECQIARDPFQ